MQPKKLKWRYDEFADYSYNVVGALEVTLINLGIVDEECQWDIDLMGSYADRYDSEAMHETICKDFKLVACKEQESGANRPIKREFDELFDRNRDFKVKFK